MLASRSSRQCPNMYHPSSWFGQWKKGLGHPQPSLCRCIACQGEDLFRLVWQHLVRLVSWHLFGLISQHIPKYHCHNRRRVLPFRCNSSWSGRSTTSRIVLCSNPPALLTQASTTCMESCYVIPLHVVNPPCAMKLYGVVPHVESTLPSQLGYYFCHEAVLVEHNLRLGFYSQRYHACGRKSLRGTMEKLEEMIAGIQTRLLWWYPCGAWIGSGRPASLAWL